MQQLGQMLSSLGLGGPANAQTNAQQASSGQGSSEPNLSALLSALQQQMENGSSGQNQPSQAPSGANLSALLSTLQQQMENGSKGNSASDLSSLLLALQQARRKMVQTLQVRPYPPYRAPHPGPTRPPSAWTPS